MAYSGQLNPIQHPCSLPPPPHAHGTGQARWQLSTVPALGAASRELVLQELEVQAQPVPGRGTGRERLTCPKPPAGPFKAGPRSYGQGLTLTVSPLSPALLGTKVWAEAQLWEEGQAPQCNPPHAHSCAEFR